MAESESSSSEQLKSTITCEVNLDTDEIEIKYKDNTTWSHITIWNCEVVPATFDLKIHNELMHATMRLKSSFDEDFHVAPTSIRAMKPLLIFAIGHDTSDDAFQMATKFVEVKKTILRFIREIDVNVTDISLRCWAGEQNVSSEHYNRNTDESKTKGKTIWVSPSKSEGLKPETNWSCSLAQDDFEIDLTSSDRTFTRLKKMFDNIYRCTLKRVIRGSLILECGHESQEDALEMVKNHVKVKAAILECLQEMDPRVSAIKFEVEYKESGQAVDDLKQHVSYLRETLRRLKELERERMSESRMSPLVRPQPSDSSGLYLSAPETERGYGHEGGVCEEQETSGPVTDLRRQQTDIDKELKATTARLHSLEITRTRASSHPSEMEALSPGATQESELPATSREEETWKSGTPLEPDTQATLTTARRDPGANSDLRDASSEGNIAAVKQILAEGLADVNCRDMIRRTPLMAAARLGHREVVELLVSEGAEVSLVDKGGNSTLHLACGGGDVETVKFVLSLNVTDINSRGGRSWTPVMRAAMEGRRDVVEFLVSEGADVSLVDKDGNNTLHLACIGGDVETVKFVLSLNVADINSRGFESRTPVMRAASWGHRDVVEFLVSEGADVSLVDDNDGDNILHHACWKGNVETVKFVLSLKVVDIDAKNKNGRTAADVARDRGHKKVVKLLEPPSCHVM